LVDQRVLATTAASGLAAAFAVHVVDRAALDEVGDERHPGRL
jgi:hypothetical protein